VDDIVDILRASAKDYRETSLQLRCSDYHASLLRWAAYEIESMRYNLECLRNGSAIVIPADRDHAVKMQLIAERWLAERETQPLLKLSDETKGKE
jgi:hypothetical protein